MRALIWDLGGTLVNTYPEVDHALAAAVRADPDDALLHEVAQLTRRSSSEAISTLAQRYGVAEEKLRAAYDATKQRWQVEPAPVMEGALEVLAAVHEQGALNLVATHRDRASAQGLIDSLGLPIHGMVCAPDGFARKPAPDLVLALLERHALTPQECLAVGDRPGDVEAARIAGVRGVLLETAGIELSAPGAERVGSLREVLALLDLQGT